MMTAGLRRWRGRFALALLVPLLMLACDTGPEPVHLGAEECAHCSMLITERRYAAQLVSTRGKAFKFDSIECLRAFVQAGAVAPGDTRSIWVTDSEAGAGWLDAHGAVFLRSPALRTPMGGGLAAYELAVDARRAAEQLGGEVLSWSQLLEDRDEAGTADPQAGYGDHGHDHGDAR
jgi:copper chaperone NosL